MQSVYSTSPADWVLSLVSITGAALAQSCVSPKICRFKFLETGFIRFLFVNRHWITNEISCLEELVQNDWWYIKSATNSWDIGKCLLFRSNWLMNTTFVATFIYEGIFMFVHRGEYGQSISITSMWKCGVVVLVTYTGFFNFLS